MMISSLEGYFVNLLGLETSLELSFKNQGSDCELLDYGLIS
jgi:hypothetical protein